MHYTELFRQGELYSMIHQGYVSVRDHLEFPLRIYNYTDKAQYDQVWNNVTMNCRGLIVDYDGNIVARGFPKFFNYGQPGAAEIALNDVVQVTDKMDGSLGIMYPTPNGYAIATRGSFHSDQAIHATRLLNLRYPNYKVEAGTTALFEIIYPDNRIVLDYGSTNDLVLLGYVDNVDGTSCGPHGFGWDGPQTEVLGYMTLAEALAIPPRPNAEGIVVREPASGNMLKIKQEDYIRLHKLVFGLSEKAVWEHLSTHNGDISGMLEGLPDEFHGWVKEKADGFINSATELFFNVLDIYRIVYNASGVTFDDQGNMLGNRGDFARAVQASVDPSYRGFMFTLFDGKSIEPGIWKMLKPKGSTPMVMMSEDVA